MTATAAPPWFPYDGHRNMSQVMADEARREANSIKASLTRPCRRCGAPVGVNCRAPNGDLNVGSHNERRLSR